MCDEDNKPYLDAKLYRRPDGRMYYDSPTVRVVAQPGYCPLCFARWAAEQDMSGIKVMLGPFDDEDEEQVTKGDET